jgi:hypothetical protein
VKAKEADLARFRATGAVVIGDRKYPAGTVFADGATGILPGDVHWWDLTVAKLSPNLVPLDAGAQSMMAASRFANEVSWRSDGANSIG